MHLLTKSCYPITALRTSGSQCLTAKINEVKCAKRNFLQIFKLGHILTMWKRKLHVLDIKYIICHKIKTKRLYAYRLLRKLYKEIAKFSYEFRIFNDLQVHLYYMLAHRHFTAVYALCKHSKLFLKESFTRVC